MNFELTEDQRLIQDTARRFAAEEIAPTLERGGAKHEFRADRVAKMGELGFFSCAVPEELGGSGMGFMESVLMAEQIAKVSASWRLPFNMQNLGPALTVTQVRHRRAEEEIRSRLGRRHAARLLRDDRAQHRLGRGQHEDPRHRQGRSLGSARQQDVDLAGARRRRRAALCLHRQVARATRASPRSSSSRRRWKGCSARADRDQARPAMRADRRVRVRGHEGAEGERARQAGRRFPHLHVAAEPDAPRLRGGRARRAPAARWISRSTTPTSAPSSASRSRSTR